MHILYIVCNVCSFNFLTHQTSISHCVPILDYAVSVLVDFSCLKMPIISVFGQ